MSTTCNNNDEVNQSQPFASYPNGIIHVFCWLLFEMYALLERNVKSRRLFARNERIVFSNPMVPMMLQSHSKICDCYLHLLLLKQQIKYRLRNSVDFMFRVFQVL